MLVIRNALSEELYRHLISNIPKELFISSRQNTYEWVPAAKALVYNNLHSVWREFIENHIGVEFFEVVAATFENQHPNIDAYVNRVAPLTVGPRFVGESYDINMDCQLTRCSPLSGLASSPRGPHWDREVVLYSGLYYLRAKDDCSEGGEFVVYRPKGNSSYDSLYCDESNHTPLDGVEEVRRIPYEPNTAIFFMNSLRSIHGVSPRHPTAHARWHVNFIAQTKFPNFIIPKKPYSDDAAINGWYGNHADK